MRHFAFKLMVLLLLPIIPAFTAAVFHPKAPSWLPNQGEDTDIGIAQVLAWDQAVLWIDARSEPQYNAAHVPGAVLLNEDAWDDLLPAVLDAWQPDMRIIIYCDSTTCEASRSVATRLHNETGFPGIYVLRGGWQAWQVHHR